MQQKAVLLQCKILLARVSSYFSGRLISQRRQWQMLGNVRVQYATCIKLTWIRKIMDFDREMVYSSMKIGFVQALYDDQYQNWISLKITLLNQTCYIYRTELCYLLYSEKLFYHLTDWDRLGIFKSSAAMLYKFFFVIFELNLTCVESCAIKGYH